MKKGPAKISLSVWMGEGSGTISVEPLVFWIEVFCFMRFSDIIWHSLNILYLYINCIHISVCFSLR